MANEDRRIIELPASESILNDDWIAKDSASQDTTRLQLSFLKQLCGGNNFAGEWHSGTVYNKEAYVTHEGKLYHNIKGGSVVAVDWTSSQWAQVSISNELRKIVESLASTFDTSTNYSVDDLVIYDNTLYRCIVAHTAGTWISSHFTTVKVSSLLLSSIMDNFTDIYWEDYSGSPVNYTKGTVIHKGLNLYRCKANTTNQSWDNSKWELVDVTDLLATEHGYIQSLFSIIAPTFSTSTSYNVGDFVIYNNQLYMCAYPHNGAWNSGHFLLYTVSNTLQALYRNLVDTYSFSGTYVKGDVVNYLGVLWRCIVDTATSPIVPPEWEQVTVEQLINEKVADVQIAGQTTTDENKISDLTSLAIEGTASGEIASFSDGSNLPMRSFVCNIDAVQDLHGYDGPWVGGGNINLFDIKAKLTDNARTYTMGGITYTRIDDSDGNALSVKGTGTATEYSFCDIPVTLPAGRYKTNVSGSDANKMGLNLRNSDRSYFKEGNEEFTFTEQTSIYIRYLVASGNIADNTITCMLYKYDGTNKDFAPYSNICPISGHTGVDAWVRGKNLYNNEVGNLSTNGVTFTKNADGSITTSGTSTSGAYYNMSNVVFPKGTYIANGCPSGGAENKYKISVYNNSTSVTIGTGDTGEGFQFEADGESEYRLFIRIANNQDMNGFTFYPMIRLATETDATYEPYTPQSQTIQVSWQTEAGEVYGGYVDLVSGVLTVTHIITTYDGSDDENWGQNTNYNLFNISIPSDYRVEQTPISNIFKGLEPQSASNLSTKANGSFALYSTYGGINIKTDVAEDVSNFKTYLSQNNMQVVYKLATPITYQLTPTQIKSLVNDVTNVWASTGNVNVKYNKDATIVINSLIARIEALENA